MAPNTIYDKDDNRFQPSEEYERVNFCAAQYYDEVQGNWEVSSCKKRVSVRKILLKLEILTEKSHLGATTESLSVSLQMSALK